MWVEQLRQNLQIQMRFGTKGRRYVIEMWVGQGNQKFSSWINIDVASSLGTSNVNTHNYSFFVVFNITRSIARTSDYHNETKCPPCHPRFNQRLQYTHTHTHTHTYTHTHTHTHTHTYTCTHIYLVKLDIVWLSIYLFIRREITVALSPTILLQGLWNNTIQSDYDS